MTFSTRRRGAKEEEGKEKKPGMVEHACNLSAGEVGQDSRGLLAVILALSVSSRLSEKTLSLKNKVSEWGRHPTSSLASVHTRTHPSTHIQANTHNRKDY